ncbi:MULTISPECIES: type II toxin-antitoxin system RatA family toxin [Thiomicrorhabdus]|uniref:Type II toxin-antitoxin system RatA family toxin n=1 Tax=Thiomicrorhabdus heinhorstiae TaxID=2748010 RepID=A0ABS0BY03_9GAMM|nr:MULTISPECIES: type II toxin-antitoxin system RatA family toxin [Thiomicrorhabdus]MBF6057884.1 type II toxin-antitoxin system RatA family toxin [Thiomicrorhabdus heinhorstiae]
MKKIARTALLPYSAKQMYDLVNDVARYPEFLPWCGGSEVLSATDSYMEASVTIAKAGIKQTFQTRNHLVPGQRIEMQLIEGPFKYLRGEWQFKVLDTDACKILFEIEFEMSSGLLSAAIGPIFEQIASTLVDSFCERAKQIYV